jgi:hypothetical protein
MNKILYTVIIGGVDTLKEPKIVSPGWEYICYTDDSTITSDVWEVVLVDSSDPRKTSRYYKTHPPEADLTVYLDATFTIKKTLDPFALSKTEGIWLNSHPQRQCIYEEAQIVIDKNLDTKETVVQQIQKYEQEGYPKQNGLYRCGIIVRNGRDPLIQKLNETWWNEIESGSWRDQISFPYACWKNNFTPNSILHGITNIYFRQSLHSSQPTEDWIYNSGEPVEKENPLITKYNTAHLILQTDRFLIPRWLKNYISPKVGRERFIELVNILNGVIVRA